MMDADVHTTASTAGAPAPLSVQNAGKDFLRGAQKSIALADVSFELRPNTLTALVGPDGAGKTTLLRLICGLLPLDRGSIRVLGFDVAAAPQAVQERVSYMPQRFGLYEDLSVAENLDLYAALHGVADAERTQRQDELLDMTDLAPFRKRLSGRLSGGMKQKLGLACTLLRPPGLLLLDEPTAGVDPLSRRELWRIVRRLAKDEGIAVLMSTAYMDEAERCDTVILLHEGRILAQGPPEELRRPAEGHCYLATPADGDAPRRVQARLLRAPGTVDAVPRSGRVRLVHPFHQAAQRAAVESALAGAILEPAAPTLEDSLMLLLRESIAPAVHTETSPSTLDAFASPNTLAASESMVFPQGVQSNDFGDNTAQDPEIVVEAREVTRRFGAFTAVDRVSFAVRRGEVFGLLGPNGAGKTTTFRMLCGLLPADEGTLRVAGVNVRERRAEARGRVGYVAQKFSLYGPLTARENLRFFAGAYGLKGSVLNERIDAVAREFSLEPLLDQPAESLPGGCKQRLAMAVALLHQPEILFLDEPTSGADPLARREFWQRISALADAGTTVIVTTHFMEEAEYCDRVLIQDGGRMLAMDTPARLRSLGARQDGGEASMEDAFIAVVERARQKNGEVPHESS